MHLNICAFVISLSNFNIFLFEYRSGTVNSNMVNSKFHLIRRYCEIFLYNSANIPCLKYTVNSNFHLIQSKTLQMNNVIVNTWKSRCSLTINAQRARWARGH